MSPLPGIILPVLFEIANVAFVQRHFCSFRTLDALYRGLHFQLPCFGFFLPARLFAHGGGCVDGSGDVVDGRGVTFFGGFSKTDVLGVVEVFGECLSDGEEFVFDHDVDVVC